ncbi:MAG: hypothetical protein MI807_00735 [Verrucomicrobiales bacterium]|nr:hypothetical protein [Verrucomicrobiales bacterium]
MSLVSRSLAEAELAQLMERFDQWRQTRPTRHDPIPDWLWEQATQLTSHLPLSRVAKRLRLNRQELKKRCGQNDQPQLTSPAPVPVPDFIEVKADPAWLATGMAIDLERPDGTRLHIDYREPQPPVAAVIHAFLESP